VAAADQAVGLLHGVTDQALRAVRLMVTVAISAFRPRTQV
jgi:hypothetical protein